MSSQKAGIEKMGESAAKDFFRSVNGIRPICVFLVLGSRFANLAGFPKTLYPVSAPSVAAN
jgi:hypothetical protein